MSEISKAMEKARRERQRRGEPVPDAILPERLVSPALPVELPLEDVEQYHSLASEISLALPSADCRVLMFVSAVTREGTSTVAREFAATLATRVETETLLVDANLRRPSVDGAFRVERDPGLSDYVLGGAPSKECLRVTRIPRLTVLPVGRPVAAPPRLAGDPRLDVLLNELRPDFEYIVVDAPPILAFSEGVQISRRADGVVIVIRSGHTRRQLHEKALEILADAGARVLGTVLNRRRYYIPRFLYERL